MSSIPSSDSGARRTTVSIGEGSRRKAEKAVLGEVRSIDPAETTKRRKKRKGSKPAKSTKAFKRVVLIAMSLLLLAIGAVFMLSRLKVMYEEMREAAAPSRKEVTPVPKEKLEDLSEVETKLFSSDPKGVATSFAYAKTVGERLEHVLDASNVEAYPEQARTAIPTRITAFGMGNAGDVRYAQYKALFSDGGLRLIAVVPTEGGPKVDWDCYARFGTAEWPDILEGEVDKAEVRVLVRPSAYYNYSFSDDKEWAAYEISSPDFDGSIFAYVHRDEDDGIALGGIFSRSNGKPVRLIVELTKSAEGLSHRQFVISDLGNVGWVKGR